MARTTIDFTLDILRMIWEKHHDWTITSIYKDAWGLAHPTDNGYTSYYLSCGTDYMLLGLLRLAERDGLDPMEVKGLPTPKYDRKEESLTKSVLAPDPLTNP